MISLDYNGNELVLVCPPRYRDYAKQIPGMKFKHLLDAYVGHSTLTVAEITIGLLARQGLEQTQAFQAWYVNEQAAVGSLLNLKRSDEDNELVVIATNGDKLYPWQANDAYFMAHAKAVIDPSALGTGKGPKALSAVRWAAALGHDVFPLLVVTRPMMLGQLKDEVEKWLPGRTIQTVTKGLTPSKRKLLFDNCADVTIIPWHLLPLHSRIAKYGAEHLTDKQREPKELNGKFKSVIWDEAHKALDPHTQITRAMWAVSDEVEYKYFLTNTPVESSPDELWCLLRAASHEHFPSRTKFIERYCLTMWQPFGPDKCIGLKPDTEDEFRRIYDRFHVYRDESYIPQLPAKEYQDFFVDMEDKQNTAYRNFEKTGVLKQKELILTATDPLVKRTRLLQMANATPVLGLKSVKDTETNQMMEQVSITSYSMPSNKVATLLEVLENYPGPLVVFMDDRLLFDLCAKELEKAKISFVEFRGGMKDRLREAGRHEFQSGSVRVALCMFQVAAEGLTLTAASRILYLNRDDSSIASEQSEGRIRRIGQKAAIVQYFDVISNDTKEIEVHQNYLAKMKVRNDTLDREDNDTRELSA